MHDDRSTDYYALLELLPSAGEADIKKAWREQLQVWHPDRFTHAPALHRKAEERTKLINLAYETLNDPAARARYDAIARPSASVKTATAQSSSPPPSSCASPPRRQASPQSRDRRGPQSPIMLTKQGQGTVMVPAIHLFVDPREPHPYDFIGFTRIAGTMRETLPAGNYAIAETPEVMATKALSVEGLSTIFSNLHENRAAFLLEMERMRAYPARFLLIEGILQHKKGGGRLNQYHKNGLLDFLDALTARYGLHIIYADSRDEAEERIANLAALHYSYYFAEQQGFGRCLTEGDV
jgi:curved DNA-binding protein CbpA